MENEDFKAGDTVKLKSGGAVMTISFIGNNIAACRWHDKQNKPQNVSYYLEELQHCSVEEE